jgi:UDP-N-acetylglucosamine--dolichyl-phosphate N-acetylglucosaminephosphotransferase
MYDLLLITFIIFSFFLTFVLIKIFIPVLFKNNLFCIDQQKKRKPKVSSAGGIPTFLGFFVSTVLFIIASSFLFNQISFHYVLILTSITFGTFVGILDDTRVTIVPKVCIYGNKQHRQGISQTLKPILTLIAFLPIVFLLLNNTYLIFPIIGKINLGLFYPLLFAPLIFIVVSNSPNLLAGTNGLEGGIMFLLTTTLGIYFMFNNNIGLAIIAFIASSSSLAFLCFNWCPAKILPGDSLTYFSGTTFVALTLVGRAEFVAGFIYIPMFIELLLKLKGKMKVRSFGDLQKDNTIKKPYKKIYSWTHIFMHYPKKLFNKKLTEKQITKSILFLQLLFCILGLILFI